MYEEPYAKLEYSNGYYMLPSGVKLIATYQNSGRFKVVETKTPAGHVGNWEAEINVYDKSQWEFTGDNAVLNEPSSFTVKKVGEDGEPLAGAVFEILDSSIIPPSVPFSPVCQYSNLTPFIGFFVSAAIFFSVNSFFVLLISASYSASPSILPSESTT